LEEGEVLAELSLQYRNLCIDTLYIYAHRGEREHPIRPCPVADLEDPRLS
jgi:hypothetical protein